MSVVDETQQPRSYGHWRRRESLGVRGLGSMGTVVVGGGGVLSALMLLVSIPLGICTGLVSLVVIVVVNRKDRYGRSLLEKGAEALAWTRSKYQGWTVYRSGPLGSIASGSCQLPGLAAQVEAREAEDAQGRRFAVLWHPKTRHVSTVLRCYPDGGALGDQDTVDHKVASFGAWLYKLGTEAGLVAASVTIETSPDPGFRLRKEVEARRGEHPPALADQIMTGLATSSRQGVSQTSCWVTLTWASKALGGRDRDLDEVILEMGARLPNLRAMLTKTGAGITQSMSVPETAAVMRSAYDPSVAEAISEEGPAAAGISWENCGPLEAEEHLGYYTHDGWTSSTWEMGIAPRGQVTETILQQFLAPHSGAPIKRATLLYRPYDLGESAKRVDSDVNVAMTNASGRRGRLRARDEANLAAARKTAAEEAAGAGLCRFGLLVTVSAPGEDVNIRREVEAVVDMLGNTARIELRKPKRSQASAFAAALPLGLVLPAHSSVGQTLRELQ